MDRILIRSKNSTLALMAAALLADGEVILRNVPRLRDVETMLEILRALGATADWVGDEQSLRIDSTTLTQQEAPYDLGAGIRAGRLRDRSAARRSAPQGIGGARREDQTRPRLRGGHDRRTPRWTGGFRRNDGQRNAKRHDGGNPRAR